MPAPNVQDKPFRVLSHQSGNLLTTPRIPSALRPVPHGEGISVPEPPKEFTIDSDEEDEDESTSGPSKPPASTEPHVSHSRSSTPQPCTLTED